MPDNRAGEEAVSVVAFDVRSHRAPAARNPWLVAAAVVIPTFMEVLDTTIANVALRYIAGGLSAPVTDSEWVITSYLAANAIILPISGWLGTRSGPAELFSALDRHVHAGVGVVRHGDEPGPLIAFRVLQGLAGGGLQPSSQGVLLDAFPKEKQGAAQTLFGIAALLAPVVGPTLGGYITDNYGWRWIFYLNVPVGLLALLFCSLTVVRSGVSQVQRTADAANVGSGSIRSACASEHDDGLLGSRAQQRAGMGLVRRSVLAGADRWRPCLSSASSA